MPRLVEGSCPGSILENCIASTSIFFAKLLRAIRWMPWRREAMKDVAGCDKPRGAASKPRSADFRMGKPGARNGASPTPEYIGREGLTGGSETSHYPEERKANATP
jgi:hypothetical protein